ncbi:MAG: hypothetical protein QXU59_06535 [Pyrobaculum sp.]
MTILTKLRCIYMLGLLLVVINATLIPVYISTMPFVYTTPITGCVDFAAYLDPASPWGISTVYVVTRDGRFNTPALDPYPTPKYIKGYVCGDFLTIRVDRWASVGPLVSVSIRGTETLYLYQGAPLEINGTAIIKIRSLTQPSVVGQFVYKTASKSLLGVYIEEYVVYGDAKISGYGIVNVTYLSLNSDKPDYYITIPMRGVKIEGVRNWEPEYNLMFSPNQTAAVGRPRVVVEQIEIPVVGECQGSAVVLNPIARPLNIYIRLETGDDYVLSTYHVPNNISTWRLREVKAKTVEGGDLPVYTITTEDGAPVSNCIVEGLNYIVYIKIGNDTYSYKTAARGETIEVITDLVKPRVVTDSQELLAKVEPEVAKLGSNVTVRIYLNNTLVAEYIKQAAPTILLNTSTLYRELKVVDLLNTPISNFIVYIGGLKFYGQRGVAKVVPVDDKIAVEINGVRYLAPLEPVVKIPTLTFESFVKVVAAAAIVGGAAAVGLKKSGGVKKREETVEI